MLGQDGRINFGYNHIMKKEIKKIVLEFGNGHGILNQKEEYEEGHLKQLAKRICKPCWELKYCPYGPLVEEFPLPPAPRTDAIKHNEHLKKILKEGKLPDGETLDEQRRKWFEEWVGMFDPEEHPVKIEQVIQYMSCSEFGHLCPAFFVSEGFTETKESRSQTRYIPRDILIRVIRRDNSICQKCRAVLFDREIEVDHIIPISRGGTTTESNLRVLCKKCNRKKSGKIEDLLHERAIIRQKRK